MQLQEHSVRWYIISNWVRAGRPRPWAVVWPAFAVLQGERPDVAAVHFGNELPSIALILLARWVLRRRTCWVWHQRQQIADPRRLGRCVSRIRVASWFFDHLVVSYKGALRSLALRGIEEGKVSVIYNSLRESEALTKPNLRSSLAIPDDAVVIANIGSLVPRKRTDLSIKAFAEARLHAQRGMHLLLIGDGPEKSSLRHCVQNLGLEAVVHFLGMRTDVRMLLLEVDILIHSSSAETCTNVVQEAMAASCPTVMMDAGAAREQIEDSVSGYVVAAGDVADLGRRLRTLVDDANLRQAMGRAAQARWLCHFRLSTSVAKHCRLYRSLKTNQIERQMPA